MVVPMAAGRARSLAWSPVGPVEVARLMDRIAFWVAGESDMQGKILIVERDTAMCDLVAGNLRSAGYEVSRARSFPEAETLVQKLRPDVTLLDWAPGTPG